MRFWGAERRRHWRHEDKIRIAEESFEPGAVVYDVAQQHEIANSLLFSWGRQAGVPLQVPWQTAAGEGRAPPTVVYYAFDDRSIPSRHSPGRCLKRDSHSPF
ncbi:hypothetical protein EN745_00165 [Mesorhizobium sp. M4A.F.Ca.ET.022.05.2.1]|nr:hypothetical protein EN745_00165 [Mesorhizobium sp. M4A.F.Ca.ET.022.05.2.1]